MKPAVPPSKHARPGRLIAVDGVNSAAVAATARALLAHVPARRGGVSRWDASGVFGDLLVAEDDAGNPSARTLLLLYAADLAFRLRWEILPALGEGRIVVAAPYIATAVAFGRAVGLPPAWLTDLFAFAPRAEQTAQAANQTIVKRGQERGGFVEFGCEWMARSNDLTTPQILERTRAHLVRVLGPPRRTRSATKATILPLK